MSYAFINRGVLINMCDKAIENIDVKIGKKRNIFLKIFFIMCMEEKNKYVQDKESLQDIKKLALYSTKQEVAINKRDVVLLTNYS